MKNEDQIFSAVRVVLYNNAIAVHCEEASEVETLLDGCCGDTEFAVSTKHDPETEFYSNGRVFRTYPTTATTGGDVYILGGTAQNSLSVSIGDQAKYSTRINDCLVWKEHSNNYVPWTMVKCMIVHNIIQRLGVAKFSCLVLTESSDI